MCVHGASEHPYCTLYHCAHLCCLRGTEVSKDHFCIIAITKATTTATSTTTITTTAATTTTNGNAVAC